MRFGNLKIGVRLGLGFTVIIVLTIIISIFAIQYIKNLSKLTTKLYDHPYTVSTAALRIQSNILRMHRSMKDIVLTTEQASINEDVRELENCEKSVYKDFDIIADRFLGDKNRVSEARNMFAQWKPIRNEIITLRLSDMTAEVSRGENTKHLESLFENLQGFIDFAADKAVEFLADAEAKRDEALKVTYAQELSIQAEQLRNSVEFF